MRQFRRRNAASVEAIEIVIKALEARGLLTCIDAETPGNLPACPPEATTILNILFAMHSVCELSHARPAKLPQVPAIDEFLDVLNRATETALEGRTRRALVIMAALNGDPSARACRLK